MGKHVVEWRQECDSCGGTGLYVGMGERDHSAVVCHTCHGKGYYDAKHTYEDFIELKKRPKIKRVFRANPGIGIGEDDRVRLTDFGGMPYQDWFDGKPFPEKSEMRKFTCPAWYYQSADYNKKPEWKECISVGSFSRCSSFSSKDKCWTRWDKEIGNK